MKRTIRAIGLAALCLIIQSAWSAETMRLVRFGSPGAEQPGVLDANGRIRDLSGVIADLGPAELGQLQLLDTIDIETLPLVPGQPRLGPPVSGTRKIIAMGFNYADHAAEVAVDLPTEPLLFTKAVTALSGPNDDIIAPRGYSAMDYEAELVVVIGRMARYVDEADALDYIAGFAVGHDMTERNFQRLRGGQFVKGKSADTFAPVGPWLVPTAYVEDVQTLAIRSRVNGELRQDSNTRHMVFGAAFAVSYISQFMTLEPGDLIYTGTPAGVGAGMDPPVWLQPGDVVEIEIEGLGAQRQKIVAPR